MKTLASFEFAAYIVSIAVVTQAAVGHQLHRLRLMTAVSQFRT